MSRIRKIEELSKSELLAIIYHWLPNTYWGVHPCKCVVCGEGPWSDYQTMDSRKGPVEVPIYTFICDECEKANDEDELRNK